MLESEYSVKALLPNREIIPGQKISFLRFSGTDLSNYIDQLSSIVAPVAADGFGLPEMMTPKRLKTRLLKEDNLILAVDKNKEVVGFLMCRIFEMGSNRFIYFSRAVRKDTQAEGVGGKLLREAITIHNPTIVAARSQNPAAIYSSMRVMASLGINDVFPITRSFGKDEKALRTLSVLVKKLRCSKKIDLNTGLFKGVYPKGRLGDYTVNNQHPEIKLIEGRLQELGMNRENGDAIFYLAFLNTTNQV